MPYTFRKAELSDAPELSRLLKAAMQTYCTRSNIPAEMLEAMNEDIADIEDRIKRCICLCCLDEDTIVATITFCIIDTPQRLSFSRKTLDYLSAFTKVGYISRFAVREDLRNEGLGIELVNRAIDLAKEAECGAVLLHSSATNKYLVEFYKNRGFELIDHEDSRGYDRGLFSNSLG